MTGNLNIDEDRFVEMREKIERRFKFTFDRDEAHWSGTVGDFHSALLKHFSNYRGRKCAAAMTFFRMRAYLRSLSPAGVTPTTGLQPLIANLRGDRWLRELAQASRLAMPMPEGTVAGFIALIGALPSAAPKDCPTVRALTFKVARLNFGRLAEDGAHTDARNIWAALTDVIAQDRAVDCSAIVPETRFIA